MAVNKNNAKKSKSAPATTIKKNTGFQETKTSLFYLIPFIATLVIVPLVIRMKKFENNLSGEYWHSAATETTDIFLYWKSVFLIAFGVILLFLLLTSFLTGNKKFKFELEYAPLTVYLVFILLSTFVSENIYFSLHGIENHFESVWVLITYVILAFYGAIVSDNTAAIKVVIYGWLIGTWILMLIGLYQAFKVDIFTTKFIKYIIFPTNPLKNILGLNFSLGQVYITLYNPNYVGYFSAITIPTFLTLAIYCREYWKKVLFAITVIGVFICTIASSAKNGLMALIVSFVFLLIMFRRQLLKRWYIFLVALLVFTGIFLGINSVRKNAMTESIKYAIDVLFNKDTTEKTRHVDSIKCNEDSLTIVYDGTPYSLVMYLDENSATNVMMFDMSGNPVETKYSGDGQSIVSIDENFPFTVTPINYSVDANTIIPSIQLSVDGFTYSFSNQLTNLNPDSTGYYYLNASGKWVTIEEPETAIFDKNPRMFSNRGFIWSRTIPLLKKYFFVGSGPDTFSLVYPNNDYVNAAYVGFLNQLVTKPHSLYLQIGVQTGAISMLAFIVFFMIYFVRSIMLYWKHPLDTLLSKLGIGLAAGLLGYMISGITNDSTITYAPVFWGMIGVAISINRIVRKELAARPAANE